MSEYEYDLSESTCQLIVRGLAIQALTCPGMRDACRAAARDLEKHEMFDSFMEYMNDVYKAVE